MLDTDIMNQFLKNTRCSKAACFFHSGGVESPEHDVVTIQIAQQDVSEVRAFGQLF
jgi:hypothetical protein